MTPTNSVKFWWSHRSIHWVNKIRVLVATTKWILLHWSTIWVFRAQENRLAATQLGPCCVLELATSLTSHLSPRSKCFTFTSPAATTRNICNPPQPQCKNIILFFFWIDFRKFLRLFFMLFFLFFLVYFFLKNSFQKALLDVSKALSLSPPNFFPIHCLNLL